MFFCCCFFITSYLIINSLKHRRSLLWWRKSFGSAGISFRKTCATSNGPYNREGVERGGKRQKQGGTVRETKKQKAKTEQRKERPVSFRQGELWLPNWMPNAAKGRDAELEHEEDIRSEREPWFASCMANVTANPAYTHHLAPICPVWDLVILTYIHHKTTARLQSACITTGSVKQLWLAS